MSEPSNSSSREVRIGIVGSRRRGDELNVRELVRELFFKYGSNLVIVSGGCRGIDSWAEDEARKLGVKVKIFQPNLNGTKSFHDVVSRYYERNKRIAEYATGGIYAFVAEDRKGGTENTIKHAQKLGRKIVLK